MSKDDGGIFFVHSACCNAHWELSVSADGTVMLSCEECGQAIGADLWEVLRGLTTQSLLGDARCDGCGEEQKPD